MSQANTMNPKRMFPTYNKPKPRRTGNGRYEVSRCVIQPKPSKHNGMLADEDGGSTSPRRYRRGKGRGK